MKRIICAALYLAAIGPLSAADLSLTFDSGLDARWKSHADKVNVVWDGTINHTPENPNSGSLKLQRSPVHMETRARINEMDGVTSKTVISLWFYDDGDDIKAFNLMIQTDGESHRVGMGLLDNVVGVDTPYMFDVDGTSTSTGVMRSAGWHKAEFGFKPGEGVEGRVDGNTWIGNNYPNVAYPDWFHFQAGSGSGANNVWVDDIYLGIDEQLDPPNSVDSWMDYSAE